MIGPQCECGERYVDFSTHLTFAEVQAMLWRAEAPFRSRTRRAVLGFWRELKLKMWEMKHGPCLLPANDNLPASKTCETCQGHGTLPPLPADEFSPAGGDGESCSTCGGWGAIEINHNHDHATQEASQ